MTSPPENLETHEDRLNLLIADFVEAVQRGETPDPARLVEPYPELAEDFQDFVRNWRQFRAAASTLPAAPAVGPVFGSTGVRRIGNYELLEPIARGGMGVVYKARQLPLNRTVAVKMLRDGVCSSADDVRRFQAEAEAVAQLDHPGIVPIYEVGQQDGFHFFSMRYVPGENLADLVARGPMRPREAARLVREMAITLDFAHQRQVIHRDLKPSNVLLEVAAAEPAAAKGPAGRVSAPTPVLMPRITDFGLAKRLTEVENLTQSGQILGTPSYMSPEQIGGAQTAVGPATDIYSLGGILYCLLTGRPPFQAADPLETLRQVRDDEPAAPSQLNPATPRDLETITLRCLEKRPERRFATAQDLADELQRFLDGRPILTRPVGAVERAIRWARRQPVVASLAAAVVLATLLGIGFSTYFGVQAERRANGERARRRELERSLYHSLITQADLEWQTNNVNRADQLLEGCALRLRNWEWGYLKRICHAERLALEGHSGPTRRVIYSPDGVKLLSASEDQTVRMWDARNGQQLAVWNCGAPAMTLAWSPDGATVVVGMEDGRLAVWDVASGRSRFEVDAHQGSVNAVAFHPREQLVASCGDDGEVKLLDVRTAGRPRVLLSLAAPLLGIAIDSTGKSLAVSGELSTVSVFDLESANLIQTLPVPASITRCVVFAHEGQQLLTAGDDEVVYTWNLRSGELVHSFEEHTASVWALAVNEDASQVASGGEDGSVILWMAETGKVLRHWKAHHLLTYCVAFRPDGREIASSGIDHLVRIWNNSTLDYVPESLGHAERVSEVAFSPTGDSVASASRDSTVRLWDANSAEPLATFRGHHGMALGVAFSRNGQWLVSAGDDGTVRRWEIRTGESLGRWDGPAAVWSVDVHPDNRRIVSGAADGKVTIWDIESPTPLQSFAAHEGEVKCVRFSPDGTWLASCGDDGLIRLWDVASGQPRHVLRGHASGVWNVAFSRGGDRLASCGSDGNVVVWNLATHERELVCSGHSGIVYAAAFSRDDSRLATAGFDQTIKLWDTESGLELLTLRAHEWSVNSVAFSPDGTTIASGSSDWHVRIWHTVPWSKAQ